MKIEEGYNVLSNYYVCSIVMSAEEYAEDPTFLKDVYMYAVKRHAIVVATHQAIDQLFITGEVKPEEINIPSPDYEFIEDERPTSDNQTLPPSSS